MSAIGALLGAVSLAAAVWVAWHLFLGWWSFMGALTDVSEVERAALNEEQKPAQRRETTVDVKASVQGPAQTGRLREAAREAYEEEKNTITIEECPRHPDGWRAKQFGKIVTRCKECEA